MNEKMDILGMALLDFLNGNADSSLEVCSEDFENDFMDISYYFRDFDSMPEIEKRALESVKGKVLEIGAGAGSHSLYLSKQGYDIHSLDISPGAVEVMRSRGLQNIRCADIYNLKEEKYDSLLLLMNGIGIAGSLAELPGFLNHLFSLLNDEGQIIFDSTDLRYLYEEEDGSFYLDLNAHYYGEMKFRYRYNKEFGDWFPWLYVDADKLSEIVSNLGYTMEVLALEDDYHYLAKLTHS